MSITTPDPRAVREAASHVRAATKLVTGLAPAPKPIDPSERLRMEMRKFRSQGARLAAMILVAEPQRLGDRDVGSFLLEIPYLRRATASEWLQRVGVNPWRPVNKLKPHERQMLAGMLVRYSKEGSA